MRTAAQDAERIRTIVEALTRRTREGRIRWRKLGANRFSATIEGIEVQSAETRERPGRYDPTHTMRIISAAGDLIATESAGPGRQTRDGVRLSRLHGAARASAQHSQAVLQQLALRLGIE